MYLSGNYAQMFEAISGQIGHLRQSGVKQRISTRKRKYSEARAIPGLVLQSIIKCINGDVLQKRNHSLDIS
jgi:hypothetical protein